MNKLARTLFLLFGLTLLGACAALQPQPATFEYLPRLYQGGTIDSLAPGVFVINSQSELEALAQKYRLQQGPYEIDLDFQLLNRTLLVVHAGRVATSGYQVEITEINTSKRKMEVKFRLQKPGKNCLIANVPEIPLQMVLINKWEGNKQAVEMETFEKDCR